MLSSILTNCLGSFPQATWYLLSIGGSGNRMSECFYNGDGRTALACAIFAFLLLAVAMFAEHAYMLVAVASPVPPGEVGWTVTNDPRMASAARSLTCQTCFLFLLTWQVIILFLVFRLINKEQMKCRIDEAWIFHMHDTLTQNAFSYSEIQFLFTKVRKII